jgi:hypothetical protein
LDWVIGELIGKLDCGTADGIAAALKLAIEQSAHRLLDDQITRLPN